ncbi:hypothetical protein [Proteus mirabilis]|uniref:hypothetical protein n=1 Tax=Proteus mirabilis TaxID=584 RepID=UPI002231D3B4|nr:hypothetical protein [Proteus mirabilis]MDM9025255.1 hypothetical protein [Proteus mirabilis]
MEFKHSPAPWVAVINTDLDLPGGLIKSGDKSIAHTLQKAIGAEQARANAHLIATAPELLEQLIRLRNKIASYKPDDDDDLDIVDSVIAKALGQQ